jgi:hypothetical protein
MFQLRYYDIFSQKRVRERYIIRILYKKKKTKKKNQTQSLGNDFNNMILTT